MATKQLDALIRRGLVATLKYEVDWLRPLLERHKVGKTGKHIKALREAINLAWKAQRSHLSKAERARFGIK